MTDRRDELVVEFLGTDRVIGPGEELTFGRAGDIVIDDNRYLHRVLGRFSWSGGMWWLNNLGSAIVINVSDSVGTSSAKVAPGSGVPLSFRSSTLTFEAGGGTYELRAELLDDVVEPTAPTRSDLDELDPEATTTASSLPLTDEQRLLLVALAESWIRGEAAGEQLPTNRQIAHLLGWTITKYNRKLDGLCRKYANAGVAGLRGSTDSLARDRRLRLVEHAVHAGIVTDADLVVLDAHRGS